MAPNAAARCSISMPVRIVQSEMSDEGETRLDRRGGEYSGV
jgi:hypothetical protein